MGSEDWDAQKALDLYILDYMKKKNMHEAAATFASEAEISTSATLKVVPSDEGLLKEWWSVFHEVYISRNQENLEAEAESSAQPQERHANAMESQHCPWPEMNQRLFSQFPIVTHIGNIIGQPLELNQWAFAQPSPSTESHLFPQLFNMAQAAQQPVQKGPGVSSGPAIATGTSRLIPKGAAFANSGLGGAPDAVTGKNKGFAPSPSEGSSQQLD